MADEQKTLDPDRLVVVRTFLNRIDADLAQGALEAAGIDAMVGARRCGGQPARIVDGRASGCLVREEDAAGRRRSAGAGPARRRREFLYS